MKNHPQSITGIILSGGRGRRFDGRDKGLILLRGRPLVSHVAESLAPQVGALWVSINRNLGRYRALQMNAVLDRWRGYPGPLAGLASVMPRVKTPYVAVVPCDTPELPANLVQCLWGTMRSHGADVCVARCDNRLFPLHAVMKTRVYRSLFAYVAGGGAEVQRWLVQQRWTSVVFVHDCLNNINTPEVLSLCTSRRHRRR